MKFGLKQKDYDLFLQLVVAPLRVANAKVFIFGSRARGKHHPFSDIDVLYVRSTADRPSAIEIANIQEAVEESQLPIKIDIVAEEDLAKSYREQALKEKVEILD